MARKVSPPVYSLHKGSGQAYTRINGRMVYLGQYNSPDSKTRYAEVVADWSAGNLEKYGQSVSVARLAVAYTRHAEGYYVKDGQPTSEVNRVKIALRFLVAHCGELGTDKFTPKHLERIREAIVEGGLSRKASNAYVGIIVRAFRFGVVEGCVNAAIWQSLKALPGLRKGRTTASESKPVLPVSPLDVIKTLRELGPIVAAMVRLQYVTGMRPGEVCSMRVCDLDTTGDVWKYQPESHKTEHHGRSRVILLGRKAQRIIRPFLNRSAESFLFSPDDPLRTGQPGIVGKTFYPERYDRTSYRRAIDRACRRAGLKSWSPNQLRHTYATIIRKRYGLEAAQILLGHSKADVTQIYAERDLLKAEAVVKEVG